MESWCVRAYVHVTSRCDIRNTVHKQATDHTPDLYLYIFYGKKISRVISNVNNCENK